MKKAIISLCLIIFLGVMIYYLISSKANTPQQDLIVLLDPGHGGDATGAVNVYDGLTVNERDLNYKIACLLKDELETYRTASGGNVIVYLTHNNEAGPTLPLKDRIITGVDKKADIIISLHNNASSDGSRKYRGAMVLVTSSHYQATEARFNDIYGIEESLAKSVLSELQMIGLTMSSDPVDYKTANNKNGLLYRVSSDGSKYPNGDTADWYSIIRNGIRAGIPSILIEHAYLDNKDDFKAYLSSENGLKKLALADAAGIVKLYKLKKISLLHKLLNRKPV